MPNNFVRFLDNVSVSSYGAGSGGDSISSSYAETASFAQSGNGPFTGSFTGSFFGNGEGLFSGSFSGSATFALQARSASHAIFADSALSASYAVSASHEIIKEVSSSHADTADTASYVETAQTASYVETAQTASYVENAISSSFATTAQTLLGSVESASFAFTASSLNPLQQDLILTGSSKISGSLEATGVISASKFTANSGSSANLPSYTFHHDSGTGLYSSNPGDLQFQLAGGGSPEISLSTGQATFRVPIQLNNNELINPSRIRGLGSITGSNFLLPISGNVIVDGVITGSDGVINPLTASYAMTASHALNSVDPFPFTGNAQITGSLGLSGSSSAITLNPSAQASLTVNSPTGNSNDAIFIQEAGVTRIQLGLAANGSEGTLNINNNAGSQIQLRSTNDNFIKPKLHLGGTSTPTEQLQVTGNAKITGSLTTTNTGSFPHIVVGKNNVTDGNIVFKTSAGPTFKIGVSGSGADNSFVVSGTSGGVEQDFVLDSEIQGLSLRDGGYVSIPQGLTTGSKKGGGVHVRAQGTNSGNSKLGIFSTDTTGPYIGNSSYGGAGTHGTFRIINGLSSDNDADSGSFIAAAFATNSIQFNLPITASSNISSSSTSTASFGTYLVEVFHPSNVL